MTPQEYQTLFDKIYPTIDVEKYGRYGQLVNTLQAVFEAAGYDITGKELAGAQHSYIVSSIGQMQLETIARSFIGWIRTEELQNYQFRSVSDGYIPPSLYNLRRPVRISVAVLNGWESDIKQARQKRGIKGRKSQQYRDFIAEVAGTSSVKERMINTAQALLDEHTRQLTEAKAIIDAENAKAMERAAYLRRTAEIIEAFCVVAGVEDAKDKATALKTQAQAIERGATARQTVVGTAASDTDDVRAAEVVAHSLKQSDKLIEVQAVWQLIYADLLADYLNVIYAVNGNSFKAMPTFAVGQHTVIPLVYGNDGYEDVAPDVLETFINDGHPAGGTNLLRLHRRNVTYLIKSADSLCNPWVDGGQIMSDLVEAGY